MPEQVLRDRQSRVIGKIRTLSNGQLEIRDRSDRLKGTYDPEINITKDSSNRMIGKGNLLKTLL
ncbi:MAG: hypothetical protein ACLFVQ_06500 [Chitinispirillaceae bacterium]